MKAGALISRGAAVLLCLALVQASIAPEAWAGVERLSEAGPAVSGGPTFAPAGPARVADLSTSLQVPALSQTPEVPGVSVGLAAPPQAGVPAAPPAAAAGPQAHPANDPAVPAAPVERPAEEPAEPAPAAQPASDHGRSWEGAVSRAAGGLRALLGLRTKAPAGTRDAGTAEELGKLYDNDLNRARSSDGADAVPGSASRTWPRLARRGAAAGPAAAHRGPAHPNDSQGLLVERRTFGDRAADKLAGVVGSWKFIIGQSALLGVWAVLNGVSFVYHWDPYPFILMNLGLSMQAAYTGPILLMSQNRQEAQDRLEAHNNHVVNLEAEAGIQAALALLAESTSDPALKSLVKAARSGKSGSAGVKNTHQHFDEERTTGQRIADATARLIGSWTFIGGMSLALAVWAALNVTAFVSHWDPYPFVFMNLMLSLQAAYTGPVLMMSQNRQAERDRLEARNDFAVNLKAAEEIRALVDHLAASRGKTDPAAPR